MKRSVRLPDHIKPERYSITLHPDLENFTFAGEEGIEVVVGKPSKQVTLHSRELEIESAQWIHHDQTSWAGKISYNKKAETATFTFPKAIPAGKGKLKLSFTGILNDKMRGFYRSKYQHKGIDKHLATTQFESTDARQAFPCFDEPAQKAIFEVTLRIPEGMTAISNTVEINIWEHQAGIKAVQFAPTPKMSTYLLAFIVGDFEYVEGKTKSGILVRVFTTPGKVHQAKFALDVAIKCLQFYEKYFAISYPLPVLDLIAVPDFAAGAMENWGAVTYRESALLIDETHSAASNRQRVAIVVAHELAHMWFGDLVTMEWWTHLWLNEGFASYMQYLAVDELFPDWQLWTQFVYLDEGVALKLDGLKNTHPIEVEVYHPDEISEIFDAISYSKGASLIRMLATFLGPKNFRDGLRHYLKKHAYSNASTEDLWRAFEEVSGQRVVRMMKNWTSCAGHPVVKVTDKGKKLELTQLRFFLSPISKKQLKDYTLWNIPISIQEKGGDRVPTERWKTLMEKKTVNLEKPKDEWFKLNAGESGFFRVSYSSEQLETLKVAVEKKELGAVDRLGLVRDAFALSQAGDLTTDQALELASGYKHEEDYTVWMELSASLTQVSDLISQQKFDGNFNKFAQELFRKIAKKMGWEKRAKEPHTATLLRGLALYNLGRYGDNKTIARAQKIWSKTVLQGKVLDPDLRGVVYNLVAENGGVKEHSKLMDMYRKETLQQERDRIGRALASFTQESLLKKTLKFALSKDVRAQDAIFIIVGVFTNPKGSNLTWQFVKANWKMLQHRYGGTHFALSRLVQGANVFHSEKIAGEMESFFKKNPTPSAARAIEQTLEQIRSNAAWLGRDSKNISKFLENFVPKNS